MIVRIMDQGQWEIPEELLGRLNGADEELKVAIAERDADKIAEILIVIRDLVRDNGKRLPEGPVRLSDMILPGPGVGIEEIADWMDCSTAENGLIPG